jgi:hypothetical protein
MKPKVSKWDEFDQVMTKWQRDYGLEVEDNFSSLKNWIKTNFIPRQEAIEAVEGIDRKPTKEEIEWMSNYQESEPNNEYKNGYNHALSDVITIIKKL